ncbi:MULTISPECIES: ABA4-like family protein [unclassified Lentilitoribacter]|uniref:ABA4-like family protein n=1 Tax=unclassified Lentilitoribacter TaxID=2647570 RepID=UPI0018D95FBF|nr:ABA4-like family protein [Lentilitoribacter sp. Alg239-R112]
MIGTLSPESIFSFSSSIVMLGWVVLLISPLIPIWSNRIAGVAIPIALSLIYCVLILVFWSGSVGGFDTLANVKLLFTQDELLLAGWVHYLAFDLFIGAWIVRTARAEGISFWFVLPCLPATFLFGPIGYLLFKFIQFSLIKSKSSKTQHIQGVA